MSVSFVSGTNQNQKQLSSELVSSCGNARCSTRHSDSHARSVAAHAET